MTEGAAAQQGGGATPPADRLSGWRRAGPPLLAAAAFLALAGIDVSLRHAWISLTWPQAEAVILDVGPPGTRSDGFRGPKGFPYPVAVSIRAEDGREFTGSLIEPLYSFHHTIDPVPPGAARPPPRPGDRIRVHVHPSGDGRAMPRDNLRARGGSLMIYGWLAFITLLNIVFPIQYRFGVRRG